MLTVDGKEEDVKREPLEEKRGLALGISASIEDVEDAVGKRVAKDDDGETKE